MGIREKILKAMQNSSCKVALERFKFSKSLMKSLNPETKKTDKKVPKLPKIAKVPKVPKNPKIAKLPKNPKQPKTSKAPKKPKKNAKLSKTPLEYQEETFDNDLISFGSFVKKAPIISLMPTQSCSKCGNVFSNSCVSIKPERVNYFFDQSRIDKFICGMCFMNMIAMD